MAIVEVPSEVVTSESILDCEPRTVKSCQAEFMMRVAPREIIRTLLRK